MEVRGIGLSDLLLGLWPSEKRCGLAFRKGSFVDIQSVYGSGFTGGTSKKDAQFWICLKVRFRNNSGYEDRVMLQRSSGFWLNVVVYVGFCRSGFGLMICVVASGLGCLDLQLKKFNDFRALRLINKRLQKTKTANIGP